MDSLVCANGFELNQSIKNSIVTFYKGAFVATVSFIFSLFKQRYNLYSEIMWKNVHPVDCGGIHTHNFKNMSLHYNHETNGSCPLMFVILLVVFPFLSVDDIGPLFHPYL